MSNSNLDGSPDGAPAAQISAVTLSGSTAAAHANGSSTAPGRDRWYSPYHFTLYCYLSNSLDVGNPPQISRRRSNEMTAAARVYRLSVILSECQTWRREKGRTVMTLPTHFAFLLGSPQVRCLANVFLWPECGIVSKSKCLLFSLRTL